MEERLEPIVVTPPQEIDVENSDESVLRTTQGADSPAEPIVETPAKPQIVNTILVKEVKYLIAKAIEEILPKLGFKTEVVDQLPLTGENGVIYFVPNGGENPNVYDEYVWVSSTDEFEKIGSTELPLNYVTTDTEQVISGEKTFTSGINLSGTNYQATIVNDSNRLKFKYAGTDRLQIGNSVFTIANSPTPNQSDTYDLGTNNDKWKNLYLSGTAYIADIAMTNSSKIYNNKFTINNGTVDTFLVDGVNGQIKAKYTILPYDDNTINLGSASSRFASLFLGTYLNVSGFVDSNLRPRYTNTYDLGTSTNGWKTLYLTDGIYGNQGRKDIDLVGGGIALGSDLYTNLIRPRADDLRDIGTSTLRYKDLHLSGVLSDGTNSVSIADLANLITYAKAQGWIN